MDKYHHYQKEYYFLLEYVFIIFLNDHRIDFVVIVGCIRVNGENINNQKMDISIKMKKKSIHHYLFSDNKIQNIIIKIIRMQKIGQQHSIHCHCFIFINLKKEKKYQIVIK